MDSNIVIEFEKMLLDPNVRKSPASVDRLLDDSFVEFGTSGNTYDKKIIIERLSLETPSEIDAFDFVSVRLSSDVIQLRFKTRRVSEDGSVTASLRSSIWRKASDGWKMVFHQGTKTNL